MADNWRKLYGTALILEVYEAIRKIRKEGQPATNIRIRDKLIEKHELAEIRGVSKVNVTRRIADQTRHLVELGYLRAKKKTSKRLHTEYYEFEITD